MSNSASGPRMYSPLRQHISDSESEEEILPNLMLGNKVILLENHNNNTTTILNGNSIYRHHDGKEMMGEEDRKMCNRSLDSNLDSVSILHSEGGHRQRMSFPRKMLFIASILLCFLTVVVFLWGAPCGEGGQCSVGGNNKRLGGNSWENSYQDMELLGNINVVSGVMGREKNFIILFRGDVINIGHAEGGRASSDSGVVQLVGGAGKVGWFITQPRQPTDIDCTLLDVNHDGNKDCILIGEHGLFAALDPSFGTVYWYLHGGDSFKFPFTWVEFPLALLDLDGDGVNDLLAACSKTDQQNYLILVSGYTGNVIGQPYLVSQCSSIRKLQIDEDHMVSYTCRNSTSLAESIKVISLDELYKSIANKPFKTKWMQWVVGKQHIIPEQHKQIENQRKVYTIDGRKLIVENQGHCPKNCKVSVQLIDERSGKENISWQYIGPQVYGMVPATLLFNNSQDTNMLKHHISGFVLKFWQWDINAKNKIANDSKPANVDKQKSNSNFTASRLTERVVLVTFNDTDFHIVNASQSDIFQICLPDKDICQPDLSHQENSLLISDIDGDGSQELVTYMTTFICSDFTSVEELPHEDITCSKEWKLHSTVRVVRLEAELPKLYEAVSHH